MENQEDSIEETFDRGVYQRDTTEAELGSVVEPKIPTTINARREEGEITNVLRESTTRENKGIFKKTSVPGFYSEGVNDTTERGNKSAQESKEDVMMGWHVTSADGTRRTSLGHESSLSGGSKQEIKSTPGKIPGAGRRQRPFCDIIGKREQRREELEKLEGDLRQRLDILECSMPAVMAWNICRMTQGASSCGIKRLLEKQFQAASELPARSTPSCHYDCRVREVEAERKLALRKVEEARALWTEKLQALEKRKRELEEARRVQQEQKDTMERLNKEIEVLREAMKKTEEEDESCRHGECGDQRCRQRWLARMSSVTSIKSGDIECLEKLQQLAEEELIIKKDIAELERREDVYMRTLQRADELWSKVEGDMVSSTRALQEQLDTKTAANQQLAVRVCELEDALEKCGTRMAACKTELEKFLSIEKLEAVIGRDDDVAEVTDRAVVARVKVTHRPIGRLDDIATVKDDEVLARIEAADEEVSAVITAIDADTEATLLGDDKYVSVRPDLADLAVDRQVDLVPVKEEESIVQPEDFDYEQQKFKEVKEYLAQLGSLEELYEDDGEPCPPDFVCNGVVTSPIGMTDEELIAIGLEPTEVTEEARKVAVNEEERERKKTEEITNEIERKPRTKIEKTTVEETKEMVADSEPITTPEVMRFDADQDVVIRRDELLSWIDKIDRIRAKIAKYPELQAVKREADILAEQIGAYIGVKPKEVVLDEAETKLGEDEIKYVPGVPVEFPKIDPIEKTQVKPVTAPDITTKATKVDIEQVKLEDESMVPEEEQEVKLKSKIPSTPISYLEEAPTEADLATEEILAEPPMVISIETPRIQEIEEDDKTMKPVTEEKPITGKAERKEEKRIPEHKERIEVQIEPEIKEPQTLFTHFEEAPTETDLKEEITDMEPFKAIPTEIPKVQQIEADDDAIKFIDKERLIVEKTEQKEEEIIAERVERIEAKMETKVEEPSVPFIPFEDVPATENLKEEITAEPSKPMETSKPIPIELPEIQQIETDHDEIKPVDEKPLIVPKVEQKEEEKIIPEHPERIEIETENLPREEVIEREAESRVEIMEMEKAPFVTIKKEIAEAAEKVAPIMDVKEVEELTIDEISAKVDLIEAEETKPSEFPIVTEAPIVEMEKIEAIKQPVLEVDVTKIKDKEMEEAVERVTSVISREEEKEKLPFIKKQELPAEVPTLPELTIEMKREEAMLLEKKFHVFEAFEVEEKILIVKAKPSEAAEISAVPIKPRPPAKPYLVLDRRTKFEERELLRVIPGTTKLLPTITSASSVEESAEEVEITTRSDVIEAELITEAQLPTEDRAPSARIISEYFKPDEPEANAEMADDRPEITGRKIPWRKRLKDQSTVTTSSAGSQTDKTSHVSHDRVERERARLTTDELLRSIKIAAGLTRGDTEREIRTINYGMRTPDDETPTRAACNCCLCGNAASSSSSMRPKLQIQPPQVDVKRATTSLTAAFQRAFIPIKTDHVIPYDRLCPDCKAKIQSKVTRDKYRIEQIVGKISHDFRESHVSSMSTGTSSRAIQRKRKTIEKKDQSCLAKMPKRKSEIAEQKQKRDLPTSSEQTEETDAKPLTPSCICFQLEKPNAGPMRKGNCYCAD